MPFARFSFTTTLCLKTGRSAPGGVQGDALQLSQSVSQSASQSVCQSASLSASQPVSQSASQSVCQSASQSVSQSVSLSCLFPSGENTRFPCQVKQRQAWLPVGWVTVCAPWLQYSTPSSPSCQWVPALFRIRERKAARERRWAPPSICWPWRS